MRKSVCAHERRSDDSRPSRLFGNALHLWMKLNKRYMNNPSQSHTAHTSTAQYKQQSIAPGNRQCKVLNPTLRDGNDDLDIVRLLVLSSQAWVSWKWMIGMSDTTGDEIAEIQLFHCLLCQLVVYGSKWVSIKAINNSEIQTFWVGKKTYKDKAISMGSPYIVVDISNWCIQRPVIILTSCDWNCCFVASHDNRNKHRTGCVRILQWNLILEVQNVRL